MVIHVVLNSSQEDKVTIGELQKQSERYYQSDHQEEK